MLKIWKFRIPLQDAIQIEMPKGAKVLAVQTQHQDARDVYNGPYLWAMVNPEAAQEIRQFRLVRTGHPIEEKNLIYIGTFQLQDGEVVFHLFEKGRPS
jgi:hypothetical protein